MSRGPVVWLAVALTVVGAVVVVTLWRSAEGCDAPEVLCTALDEMERVPGVVAVDVDYQVTRHDPKDGDAALATWTVRLDGRLTPTEAGAAAGRVAATQPGAPVRVDLGQTLVIQAGAAEDSDAPPPVSVDADGDAARATTRAFAFWQAGASQVSNGSVEAAEPDELLALADLAADRGYRTSLAMADGSVRYETTDDVVPGQVRLVVEVARLDHAESVRMGYDGILRVHTGSAAGSAATAALVRWLEEHRPPGGVPTAYAVTTPGYARVLHGWVGGVRPPAPEPHPVPMPDGVVPWPSDTSAPECTGTDLSMTLGGLDAATGARYLAVLARNVSRRPCALEGVPVVAFLDADGAEQPRVTIAPAFPGVVAERVVVPVGQQVMATLEWRAMSTANDTHVTTAVRVTPVAGAAPVRLVPHPGRGGPVMLDVLDGAEVRIGPWAQAVEGWSTP